MQNGRSPTHLRPPGAANCTYSDQRLEEACKVALKQMNRPRYKDIKHILETGEDLCQPQESVPGKYTRGGDYFGL